MRYEAKSAPIAHRAVRVMERREDGAPNGEYDGYWKPEKRVIILYPSKGSWIYGKLVKKTINEWELKIVC